MQQYNAVPQTPLLTSQVLKEETEQWPEVQQEMSVALKEMRVEEQTIKVKMPNQSNSDLVKKRRERGNVPATINEQMSTEETN